MNVKPIKILLVGSSAFSREHTRNMLAEAESPTFLPELVTAGRLAEGLEHLAEDEVDVVLLDVTLPDSCELQTFWEVQRHAPDVPIVLLTGLEDEHMARDALRIGAEDYLVKGQITGSLLRLSILHAIDRKRATLELRQRSEHLENLVRARTTDLDESNRRLKQEAVQRKDAEDNLRTKVMQLERANTELQQILTVISHDLQEPLRMVSSYTQLLAHRYQSRLNGDADDFINYAVEGARRMQMLINDLITFSRVTTRARPAESCNCDAILDGVLFELDCIIQEKCAVITRDSLPTIRADKRQLRQVFLSLISNALKFQREAAPRIHVSARQADHEWVFSIDDNGIGMNGQYKNSIFEIFRRLHGRDVYPGTGAGLAIAKRIVEHHGGNIWAESELGRGSTFYFTIPTKHQEGVTEHV
jgi:signal transduction histidine kinase